MIKLYLSFRSPDFRKELFYQGISQVKEGCSWRVELEKWVRTFQQLGSEEYHYIRVAAIDEDRRQILAYVDLEHGKIKETQIPQQEDLFD